MSDHQAQHGGPLEDTWKWLAYTPIMLSMLVACIVLLVQGIAWLMTAQWHWMTLADIDVYASPGRSAAGISNEIFEWLYHDVPLFVWCLVIIPLAWRMLTALIERVMPLPPNE